MRPRAGQSVIDQRRGRSGQPNDIRPATIPRQLMLGQITGFLRYFCLRLRQGHVTGEVFEHLLIAHGLPRFR